MDDQSGVPRDSAAKVIRLQSLVRRWLARRVCAILSQERSQQVVCQNVPDGYAARGDAWQGKPEVIMTKKLSSMENTTYCVTATRGEGEAFISLCTEEKRRLFEAHRKTAMRSVRQWEQQQVRERITARADRLAKYRSENHARLIDLQKGAMVGRVRWWCCGRNALIRAASHATVRCTMSSQFAGQPSTATLSASSSFSTKALMLTRPV
jgi:hypothetical protein